MEIPGLYNPLAQENPVKQGTDKERSQLKKLGEALKPDKILKVNLDNSKVKIETRENGKGMKITFKLNKEESEGFKNICDMSKPDGVGLEQFVKFLVFKGLDTYEKEYKERVEKFKKEHPEEFAKMEADIRAAEENSIEPVETEDPKVDIIKD